MSRVPGYLIYTGYSLALFEKLSQTSRCCSSLTETVQSVKSPVQEQDYKASVCVRSRFGPGHKQPCVLQTTRTSQVCHHWSSVCLLTTLPRAHSGLTGSGNMVGEPRGDIWELRKGKGQFWANRASYIAGLPVYPLLFTLAQAGTVVT